MESEQTGIVRHQIGQLDQYEANPQPATTDDAAEVESADANNVRSMTPTQCRNEAIAMKSEELADYVTKSGWGDMLRKLVQLKPYIEVLWSRFDELKRGQMIAGCPTKGEFSLKCLNRSIRAVQYVLYGRTPDKPKANIVRPSSESNADADDSPHDEPVKKSEREEIKSGKELLIEHTHEMLNGLTGESVKNDAMRIARAVSQLKDLQQAIAEGMFGSDACTAAVVPPPSQPPLIVGDPVPEPDPGSLEELRQQISQKADISEIEEELTAFLTELAQPLLEHHAYHPTLEITVRVGREGYLRVAEGDWVECEGSSRFTKLTGQGTPIGKVVGVDGRSHPRIRWYDGSGWTKPYSFSNEYSPEYQCSATLRVLFPYQAAELYPEAFESYAAEPKGKKVPRKSAVRKQEASPVPNSDEQAAS